MSKVNDLLISASEKFIANLVIEKLPVKFVYHNFANILMVRKNAELIGEKAGLTEEEMNILRISALFTDVGYVNSSENIKAESITIATAYLNEQGIDQETIAHIAQTIRATEQYPDSKDKVAEVLCDACMMFIASDNAMELFDMLMDETILIKQDPDKRVVYEKAYLDFLSKHTYFTEYGKTELQPKKEAVMRRISDRIKRHKLVDKKEADSRKNMYYPRGVETMFRITARNQINLNSIADHKSNILISVNAIIISIIITMLTGKIGNISGNIIPILVFLVICLITIIIAIMSTRPNIVTEKFSKEDIIEKNVDLIFFGNFIKLSFDEYREALKDLMDDDDRLYTTMIKNQYTLGKILAKKFRLVKIAYNIFMVGIIITVIVFLVNLIIAHNQSI